MSKGWRALISDLAFVAAHKSRVTPLVAATFLAPWRWNDSSMKCCLALMDMAGHVVKVVRVRGVSAWQRCTVVPSCLDFVCVADKQTSMVRVIDPATEEVVMTEDDDQAPVD